MPTILRIDLGKLSLWSLIIGSVVVPCLRSQATSRDLDGHFKSSRGFQQTSPLSLRTPLCAPCAAPSGASCSSSTFVLPMKLKSPPFLGVPPHYGFCDVACLTSPIQGHFLRTKKEESNHETDIPSYMGRCWGASNSCNLCHVQSAQVFPAI